MKVKSKLLLTRDLTHALLKCEYFRERNAVGVEPFRLTNRHVSTICQVRVHFKDNERLYWIKLAQSAEQEYRFLQSTYPQFRDVPQLAVVKPVTYLEEFSVLITEHTDGELLSSRIKRRLNRLSALLCKDEDIRRDCYMCGKWLALLHSYELQSDQQYNLEELIDYIEVRLKLLVDGLALEKGFADQVRAYLLETLSKVPQEDLVRVKTHGDYAPYNVLVSGNELVVLDPSVGGYFGRLGNYCSRYEDTVHFYNFLNEMSSQVVGSGTRKILVARFLDGYNDNSRLAVDVSSPAFKAFLVKYKLLNALDTWPSITKALIGEKGRARTLQRWFEKTCVD